MKVWTVEAHDQEKEFGGQRRIITRHIRSVPCSSRSRIIPPLDCGPSAKLFKDFDLATLTRAN